MNSTRPQMVIVAVLVCLFAVGMAGLLNFFKYRSNAERIINERLVVTGSSIENSIRSSLALGMQFADLGTLPGTLERERATDDLILSIEVFDVEGKPLYSTDRLRAARSIPVAWLEAARQAVGKDWFVKAGTESAAGIALENNFGLLLGWVVLRYSDEQVKTTTSAVARELAFTTFGVFIVAAILASFSMVMLMGGVSRDFDSVQMAVSSGDPLQTRPSLRKGPFGRALRRFLDSVRGAEAEIALLRGELEQGARR